MAIAGGEKMHPLIDALNADVKVKDKIHHYWETRPDVSEAEMGYRLEDRGVYFLYRGWDDVGQQREAFESVDGTYLEAVVRLLDEPGFIGHGVESWDIGHSHNGCIERL